MGRSHRVFDQAAILGGGRIRERMIDRAIVGQQFNRRAREKLALLAFPRLLDRKPFPISPTVIIVSRPRARSENRIETRVEPFEVGTVARRVGNWRGLMS